MGYYPSRKTTAGTDWPSLQHWSLYEQTTAYRPHSWANSVCRVRSSCSTAYNPTAKIAPRVRTAQEDPPRVAIIKTEVKRELKQKIRDDWTDEQAVDDIERQLQGKGFAQPVVDHAIRPQRPAQKLLVDALKGLVGDILEGQYNRRDNAIECHNCILHVEEGATVRRSYLQRHANGLA